MRQQLAEITEVDGAGNPLRGQTVIQVRAHSVGERYAGEEAKHKIDRVGPKDKRPVAQGELKSLDKEVG